MRASRQQAELVREYAKSAGWSIRTAQNHRKKNDPRWREWCDNRLAKRIVAAPDRERARVAEAAAQAGADGEAAEIPDFDLPEERMEFVAKRNAENIEKLLETAISQGDSIEISSLVKSHETAVKVWEGAKKNAQSARLDAGKYLRVEDLEPYNKSMFALKSVMDQMPTELGPKANPADKPFGITASAEWLRGRFMPNYQSALAELKALGGA